MNDQSPTAADASELQFNEAEYAAPTTAGATCAACQQTIPDHYFQINGAILCERCSTAIKAQLTGGSGFLRFIKASVYGLAASIAGFAIYFGVLKLTGYEVGLISILVGYMVGAAVRKGSEGRGGALYQVIAVCCTYLAIAASYSALVVPQMIAQIKNEKAATELQKAQKADNEKAAIAPDAEPKDVEPKISNADEPEAPKDLTPAGIVVALALVFAFMLAIPIIVGFSQPIGLLIIGFALWEAFKLTRKVELVITGPHNVGQTPAPAATNA